MRLYWPGIFRSGLLLLKNHLTHERKRNHNTDARSELQRAQRQAKTSRRHGTRGHRPFVRSIQQIQSRSGKPPEPFLRITAITGANQENVAYPSGTCAERTAAYYAHATYPDARFKTIAIAAVGTDGHEIPEPVAPCGACRQALLEYETLAHHNVEVILVGSRAIYVLPSVRSTLPLAFSEF